MGSCQCRPVVTCPSPTKYDLRKRHEKVDPLGQPQISVRSEISTFDSLKSHDNVHNDNKFGGVRVSPASEDHVSDKADEEANTNTTDDIIQDHIANYDFDTISEKSRGSKSSDKDSVIGSECTSMAYSSSRSGAQDEVHAFNEGSADDEKHDKNSRSGSLDSEDLDKFDCSQTSGFFGTISERPYMSSRLGHRQISYTSQDSREILHWKKGNRLGRGSFGTVWLGMMATGELIAVKQIELIETDMKEVEKEYAKIYQEVSILKEFRHRNIVGYLGSSYEKSENHIISVFMEYVPGGTLASILQKFGALEEPITSIYSRQLLDAVSYLHSSNIVHRDIKSANILLMPEGVIKLIDFGCAKRLALRMSRSGNYLQQSLRGTPYWMAPEVINETGHGKKSDIWGDREPLAAIYAIGSDEYPVPLLPDTFSEQAREFVQLCLIRDKHKRPQAARLLSHSFLKRPTSNTSASSARWGHRMKERT